MPGIGSLLTTLVAQAQTAILPPLLIGVMALGGYFAMIGNEKLAKATIVGGLVGAAIVLGAPTLAALVGGHA